MILLTESRVIPGTPNHGTPIGKLPILFPYHSHIFRDSSGSGIVGAMGPISWGSLKIPLTEVAGQLI